MYFLLGKIIMANCSPERSDYIESNTIISCTNNSSYLIDFEGNLWTLGKNWVLFFL